MKTFSGPLMTDDYNTWKRGFPDHDFNQRCSVSLLGPASAMSGQHTNADDFLCVVLQGLCHWYRSKLTIWQQRTWGLEGSYTACGYFRVALMDQPGLPELECLSPDSPKQQRLRWWRLCDSMILLVIIRLYSVLGLRALSRWRDTIIDRSMLGIILPGELAGYLELPARW